MQKNIRVPYAEAVYGKAEIKAVNKILANPLKIVAGPAVKEFERRISGIFGKQRGIMVNSGSSANLLAFEVLNLPPGSEVITPALTFSTTLAPILQKRLKPVFTDVKTGTYVIDPDKVEKLITKKTKAMIVPSLIGNIPTRRYLECCIEFEVLHCTYRRTCCFFCSKDLTNRHKRCVRSAPI